MPTQLQFRRGTTAQNNAFTGAAGEISVDETIDTIRVHDGTTAGGHEITQNAASQTLTNKTLTSPVISTISNTGTLTLPTSTDTLVGRATTDTLTNKTLTSPTITGTGAIAGTFTGNLTGDVTGNADTATALSSAVTVELSGDVTGSATFTSAGDTATIAATIAADSVALGTDTTGNYVAAGATSGNGISGSVSSEGGTFTVTSNATNANTASTIVFRDGSGNFSAGVVTATATAARYADLAERYTSDGDYGPGTVVVFGGDAEVTQSTQRLSKKVAGIVSTDPAFLMNESLEDGVSVGLVGRVPCKVVGEISKGDMMVTSSVIGYAEAWKEEGDPPMGTVIGKALENKTGLGEDVIEVVVGRM